MGDTILYPTDHMQNTATNVQTSINDLWPNHNYMLQSAVLSVSGLFPGPAVSVFEGHINTWNTSLHNCYQAIGWIMDNLHQGGVNAFILDENIRDYYTPFGG